MNRCCSELTRRGFLGRAAAVGAAGALTGLVGDGLATRLAFAAPTYTGDTLVVLSLRGGFDGMSAVVPTGDPEYLKARPSIGVPASRLIGGGGFFGLHPALAPLLPFWTDGRLAAVHAVGQQDPTRSHFAALEEMERAAPGTSLRTGWIDRMLGVRGTGSVWGGVSVGGALGPQAFAGPTPDLALQSVDGFGLEGEGDSGPMGATLRALYADAPPIVAAPALGTLAAVGTTTALKEQGYTPANGAVYPDTPLGTAMRDVARLIKAKVGLQAACVDYGDWDMHEGLGAPVAGNWMHDHLTELARALAAFATDLGTTGLAGVTLLTLSEFGRRVGENGSSGLDHGHANAMLVLGGGVAGGTVYGTWPGLAEAQLDDGSLRGTTDYRAVIGEILQKRCGMGSLAGVFPGVEPGRLGLVRART
ncbi:MAG TPA: DUF1501 domain-containing protein [Mycobacteriales bacterium]|jgi:uncharacterized protein (DUF1501 family)|nr:DUF1501 domain-containing protein [Mycobacteriales bacterium]